MYVSILYEPPSGPVNVRLGLHWFGRPEQLVLVISAEVLVPVSAESER